VAFIANYLSDQLSQNKSTLKQLEAAQSLLETQQKTLDQYEDMVPTLKDIAHMDHDINTPLCVITLSLGRVKRYAKEYQNDGLDRSNNEITEAVNKISQILLRLQPLKGNPALNYRTGSPHPANIKELSSAEVVPGKTPYSLQTDAAKRDKKDEEEG
jgi:hypothetical protein